MVEVEGVVGVVEGRHLVLVVVQEQQVLTHQ
jgi:hypothetical protein